MEPKEIKTTERIEKMKRKNRAYYGNIYEYISKFLVYFHELQTIFGMFYKYLFHKKKENLANEYGKLKTQITFGLFIG